MINKENLQKIILFFEDKKKNLTFEEQSFFSKIQSFLSNQTTPETRQDSTLRTISGRESDRTTITKNKKWDWNVEEIFGELRKIFNINVELEEFKEFYKKIENINFFKSFQ